MVRRAGAHQSGGVRSNSLQHRVEEGGGGRETGGETGGCQCGERRPTLLLLLHGHTMEQLPTEYYPLDVWERLEAALTCLSTDSVTGEPQ